MSQYIPFTVDTRPMADEINKVSRHVDNTTAAVVSMKAAVVMAEKESADLVCNNVNRGFHALMLSQVSQKTAKLQSEVNSHLLRLNQQSKLSNQSRIGCNATIFVLLHDIQNCLEQSIRNCANECRNSTSLSSNLPPRKSKPQQTGCVTWLPQHLLCSQSQ